jgi:hypothetical protein
MKDFFKLGIGAALNRLFGNENKEVAVTASSSSSGEPLSNRFEPSAETELPLTLSIWTIERNRYVAARALYTEIEVFRSHAILLCEDIYGYVLDTPSGESVVIEARTGSLVGHSLEVVRDGIREMTRVQLNNQLDTGKKEFDRMKKHEMSNDEFWKSIKMGSSDLEIAQDFQE